jgi:hypothetical protein
LRSLLVKAFEDRREAHASSRLPKAQAARTGIPFLCAATISECFATVCDETTKGLIR